MAVRDNKGRHFMVVLVADLAGGAAVGRVDICTNRLPAQ